MNDYSYEILDLLDEYKGNTEAILQGEKSFWCLYALSPLRENLFEWVEFPDHAKILQAGSDYGSCTGLFAKRAKEVVVLDSRDENMEVSKRRHGSCKNIFYQRGNMLDFPETLLGKQFDLVIFPGGLEEYGKEQAAFVLRKAAGCLKDGGTLLVPAENETGVRYWMGAAPREASFLETEFRSLFETLKQEQGGSLQMYYPVPDFRYPASIYSDAYLPGAGDVTNISARLDGPGFLFGSEEEAMARICKNGVFTKFTNSFLAVWEKETL